MRRLDAMPALSEEILTNRVLMHNPCHFSRRRPAYVQRGKPKRCCAALRTAGERDVPTVRRTMWVCSEPSGADHVPTNGREVAGTNIRWILIRLARQCPKSSVAADNYLDSTHARAPCKQSTAN
jgi:hypothetical protein